MTSTRDIKLSSAQRRYMKEIADAQPRPAIYNGRCRRTIEILEAHGLVTATWEPVDAGFDVTERWRVFLTHKGEEWVSRRWDELEKERRERLHR